MKSSKGGTNGFFLINTEDGEIEPLLSPKAKLRLLPIGLLGPNPPDDAGIKGGRDILLGFLEGDTKMLF